MATTQLALSHLHATFLAIVPRVILHGQIYFRHVRCPIQREDLIAEMVAISWKWHVSLARRGKDASQFVSAIARYAARAVNSGRRLAGIERPKDVLSRRAQRERGFVVESLSPSTQASHEQLYSTPHGQHLQDVYEERLQDNTLTPPPDQAAFRIDFPAWLQTLTARERRMIRLMARNERTRDLSQQFEVSPARISQLRREFHDDWTRFCGDQAGISLA